MEDGTGLEMRVPVMFAPPGAALSKVRHRTEGKLAISSMDDVIRLSLHTHSVAQPMASTPLTRHNAVIFDGYERTADSSGHKSGMQSTMARSLIWLLSRTTDSPGSSSASGGSTIANFERQRRARNGWREPLLPIGIRGL